MIKVTYEDKGIFVITKDNEYVIKGDLKAKINDSSISPNNQWVAFATDRGVVVFDVEIRAYKAYRLSGEWDEPVFSTIYGVSK